MPLRYMPAAHDSVHARQADCPALGWNEFVLHGGHTACPVRFWYVPAAHSLHAVWAPGASWYKPVPHAKQAGVVVARQRPKM